LFWEDISKIEDDYCRNGEIKFKMVKMNNEMLKFIISINSYDEESINLKVDEFSQKVFSTIKLIDDCVVIVDYHNEMKQGVLNYDKILSRYGDYTGYEASCNELRISDFIEIKNFEEAPFLLRLLNNLKTFLNNRYPQYNFVIIGCIKKSEIELRFHILRKNEESWLSEDIDEFNEAIIVEIV
jgi:hypothetical protein